MYPMLNDLILLFISFSISLILYPLYIKFLYRFQLGEEIRFDGPETHIKKSGTPTMGGMVILVAVFITTLFLNLNITQTIFPLFVIALSGLFGIIEDLTKISAKTGYDFFKFNPSNNLIVKFTKKFLNFVFGKPAELFVEFWRILGSKTDKGLQSYQKFLIQAGIAGFVSYWTYFKLGWDYIWFPFIENITVGYFYPIFIFIFFFLVLNSVNITDGLDGLAAGLSLISLTAFWVICSYLGYNSLSGFIATFIGSILVFLYFNVYPARLFMGNVGSHILGAALALIPILVHREILIFVIYLVFLVDGLSSPLQSFFFKLTKKRIFLMAPLHHHFELKGWPETKVTLRFWIFGIVTSLIGIFIAIL
jgi:phospho-N-acetylmuramoyl-pentapeptide-transferase